MDHNGPAEQLNRFFVRLFWPLRCSKPKPCQLLPTLPKTISFIKFLHEIFGDVFAPYVHRLPQYYAQIALRTVPKINHFSPKIPGSKNSCFYIVNRTFKGMCEVYYRAKPLKVQFTMQNGAFLHDMGENSTLVDFSRLFFHRMQKKIFFFF